MEKIVRARPLEQPPAEAKPADHSPGIAAALKDQAETNLLALEVSKVLKEQIVAELNGSKEAMKALVERVTATREITVSDIKRDADGKIKGFKILASVPKLH
jgi:hypothetical protein